MLTCTGAHTYTGTVIRNIIISNKKTKGLLKRIKKSYQLRKTFSYVNSSVDNTRTEFLIFTLL